MENIDNLTEALKVIEQKDKEIAELKALLTKGQVFNRSQLNPEFLKIIDGIDKNYTSR